MNVEYSCQISVLMSAYNVGAYIKDAIISVLNQSFTDFEFLIINDGSSDNTEIIVKEFSDERIKLITNSSNKGLIYSLNYGLQIAKGKYIARMDADDLMLPERLQKQYDFLEANPSVSMLGGAYRILNTHIVVPFPKYNEEIKLKMLKSTGFSHPTVMIRSDIIKKEELLYNQAYPSAEDYCMWVDMALKRVEFANMDDIVLEYRLHPDQTTQAKAVQQQDSANRIRIKYYNSIFKNILTKEDLDLLKDYNIIANQNISNTFSLLMKIYYANQTIKFFNKDLFRLFICGIIYSNFELYKSSFKSDFKKIFFRRMPLRIRFFICKYFIKNIL